MAAVERILIRLPNWLGDALMARPLLHAVRRALPAAAIAGVAPAPVLGLLAADGVIDLPEPWSPESMGRRALIGRLRAWRPEAAVVLPPSFSSALFAWRVGAPLRAGYRHEFREALLTYAPRRPARGERHLSDEYLELGTPLGATPVEAPVLALAAGAIGSAARVLEAHGLADEEFAVLGPGPSYFLGKLFDDHRSKRSICRSWKNISCLKLKTWNLTLIIIENLKSYEQT